jgi:ribosomal protein S18 acetylase RimI-like enzyme
MKTRIRRALPDDLEALIDLSRRTIRASYRAFLGDAAVDAFLDSGAADRYVREHRERCTVISIDVGRVVGYAACRGSLIDLMLIDPAFQRQGLGTALLHAVERALRPGHPELRLESFAANQPANAFYRKNGWREVGRYLDPESGAIKIEFRKGPR